MGHTSSVIGTSGFATVGNENFSPAPPNRPPNSSEPVPVEPLPGVPPPPAPVAPPEPPSAAGNDSDGGWLAPKSAEWCRSAPSPPNKFVGRRKPSGEEGPSGGDDTKPPGTPGTAEYMVEVHGRAWAWSWSCAADDDAEGGGNEDGASLLTAWADGGGPNDSQDVSSGWFEADKGSGAAAASAEWK